MYESARNSNTDIILSLSWRRHLYRWLSLINNNNSKRNQRVKGQQQTHHTAKLLIETITTYKLNHSSMVSLCAVVNHHLLRPDQVPSWVGTVRASSESEILPSYVPLCSSPVSPQTPPPELLLALHRRRIKQTETDLDLGSIGNVPHKPLQPS